MRFCLLLSAALVMSAAPPQTGLTSEFAPLRAYDGTWHVQVSGQKPDTLVNQCSALSTFFVCAQTVNGAASGLIIFIPSGAPGHYLTQTVRPDGRATGVDQMQINGDVWTFTSRRDAYGKTTFYRTVNTFSGRSRIHFESSHSSDQKQWTVERSGDETKIAGGR